MAEHTDQGVCWPSSMHEVSAPVAVQLPLLVALTAEGRFLISEREHEPQRCDEVSAILTSLLTTARKRGQNLLEALRSVTGASPLEAASLT